jgi:hypothetical protein
VARPIPATVTRIVKTSVALLSAAILGLVFAGPADASTGSKSITINQVRGELRQASDALDRIWGDDSSDDLGDDGTGDDGSGDDVPDDPSDDFSDDSGVDLTAVADNLEHTAAAKQLAQKVKKGKNRAFALIAVTDQADDNVFEYADDIGWVDPDEQPTFVDALTQSLTVRGSAVNAMISTAAKQTVSTRSKLLATIGDDLSDGDPEVLLDTLAEEDGYGATFPVKDTVAPILAGMIDDTDKVAANLNALSDKLASSERKDVRDAVDSLNGQVDDLPDYVNDLFGDFEDYDDPAAGQASFCGYLAQEPLPKPDACG